VASGVKTGGAAAGNKLPAGRRQSCFFHNIPYGVLRFTTCGDLTLLAMCVAGAPVRPAAVKSTAEETPKAKITPKQSVLLMDLLDANKHNGDLWDDAPLKPTASKKPAQSTPVKAAPATHTGGLATATASVSVAAASSPGHAASTPTPAPAPVHAAAGVTDGQSVIPAARDAATAATAEAVGSAVPTRQETASAAMSPVPTTAPATASSSAQPQTDDTTALLDSLPPVPIQPVRVTVVPAAAESPAEETDFVATKTPVEL
jgi:hypothetical protein